MMDLLQRASALAACPLFADLAPAVLIRLAERAGSTELAAGERRTTDDMVWIVAAGALAVAVHGTVGLDATASTMRRNGARAERGRVLGLIRVVVPSTPAIEVIAETPSTVLGLSIDDVRDILDEDPAALAALAGVLARLLLEPTT
jgi:CRP-like cAMP-binding protein